MLFSKNIPNPKKYIHTILVGGFNPSEKYESNWTSSPIFGMNIKRYLSCHHLVMTKTSVTSKRSKLALPNFNSFSTPIPIPSMYGRFTYIWLICMVNVGKYTIHGCYGIWVVSQAPSTQLVSRWHSCSWNPQKCCRRNFYQFCTRPLCEIFRVFFLGEDFVKAKNTEKTRAWSMVFKCLFLRTANFVELVCFCYIWYNQSAI